MQLITIITMRVIYHSVSWQG